MAGVGAGRRPSFGLQLILNTGPDAAAQLNVEGFHCIEEVSMVHTG